jgi:hypothetical protein
VKEDDLGLHVVLSKFEIAAHLAEEVHVVISGFREKLMPFEMFKLPKLEGVSVELAGNPVSAGHSHSIHVSVVNEPHLAVSIKDGVLCRGVAACFEVWCRSDSPPGDHAIASKHRGGDSAM